MYSHGPMAFHVARIDNWPVLREPNLTVGRSWRTWC